MSCFLICNLGGNDKEPQVNYLEQMDGQPLKTMISDFEKDVIVFALKTHRGNVAQTVKQLDIGKTAFYDKMKRYSISPKDHK